MKINPFQIVIIILLATFFVLSQSGCKNTPQLINTSLVAENAAYFGTVEYLKSHASDRDKFVLAANSVRALIALGSFSHDDLAKALQQLPVQELIGPNGTLVVDEAIMLWDLEGKELIGIDAAQKFNAFVLPVAKATLAGLDRALAQ